MRERPGSPQADPQGGPPPHRQGWRDAWPGLGRRGRENPELQGKARESGHQRGQKHPRAPKARQGSLALDASKSHQKTEEAAHHPAYWGSGTHRKASAGEDKKDWAPQPGRRKEGGRGPGDYRGTPSKGLSRAEGGISGFGREWVPSEQRRGGAASLCRRRRRTCQGGDAPKAKQGRSEPG